MIRHKAHHFPDYALKICLFYIGVTLDLLEWNINERTLI